MGITLQIKRTTGSNQPGSLADGELAYSHGNNHLLVGDGSTIKVIGGKNGYGAKLTNIFSTSFKVESVDRKRQRVVTAEYLSLIHI